MNRDTTDARQREVLTIKGKAYRQVFDDEIAEGDRACGIPYDGVGEVVWGGRYHCYNNHLGGSYWLLMGWQRRQVAFDKIYQEITA